MSRIGYGRLTKTEDGYDLPIVGGVFTRPKAVTDDRGIQHPSSIFRIWTNTELKEIGFARVKIADIPSGYRAKSTADAWGEDDSVLRGVVLEEIPEPTINPENYRHDRKQKMITDMGSGSFEEAIGNELDSLLKHVNNIRMKKDEIAQATTVDDLKSILSAICDLPQDLDNVIGKWTAAKAAFPKPE